MDLLYDHLRFFNPDGSEVFVQNKNGVRRRAAEVWYDIDHWIDKDTFHEGRRPTNEWLEALRARMGSDEWTAVYDLSLCRWVIGYLGSISRRWMPAVIDGVEVEVFHPERVLVLPYVCEDPSPAGTREAWPLDRRIIDHLEDVMGTTPGARWGRYCDAMYSALRARWAERVAATEPVADVTRWAMRKTDADQGAPSSSKEQRIAAQADAQARMARLEQEHMKPHADALRHAAA